jgi:hypothetical protein
MESYERLVVFIVIVAAADLSTEAILLKPPFIQGLEDNKTS